MTHCVQWLISSLIGFNESRDGVAEFRLLCFPVRAEDQPEMMWAGGLQPCARVPLRPLFGIQHLSVGRISCSDTDQRIMKGEKNHLISLSFLDPIRTDLWMRGQRRPDSENGCRPPHRERERVILWACACVWLALSRTYGWGGSGCVGGRDGWWHSDNLKGGVVMRCTIWGKFWSGRRRRKSVFTSQSCHHKQLGKQSLSVQSIY